MQVATAADPNAYAILGGKNVGRFEIAQSAHMVQILSETLYPNKRKAVVREYLCNAVDAHQMAGCLDRFIEVTLNSSEFKVQDFGPGIPHDKMAEVFCTYGGSTKTDDATQIGGFGLGCKAGFAVADHFTVINCHGGRRMVYAITKGTAETGGLPNFRVMVDTPTSDTGLTVSVPIDTSSEWIRLVQQLTQQGGFKVKLNGGEITGVPDFSKVDKSGFALVKKDILGEAGRLGCRYGNVIYPIRHAELVTEIHKVKEIFGSSEYGLLICAPPNSVSIVPSREDLSYDERTIEFLRERLTRISTSFVRHTDQVLNHLIKRTLRKRYTRQNWPTLRLSESDIQKRSDDLIFGSMEKIAEVFALHRHWGSYHQYGKIARQAYKVFPSKYTRGLIGSRSQIGDVIAVLNKMEMQDKLLRIQRAMPDIALFRASTNGSSRDSRMPKLYPLKHKLSLSYYTKDNEKLPKLVIAESQRVAVHHAKNFDWVIVARLDTPRMKQLKELIARMKMDHLVVVKFAATPPKIATKRKSEEKSFARWSPDVIRAFEGSPRVQMRRQQVEVCGPPTELRQHYYRNKAHDVPATYIGVEARSTTPKAFLAYPAMRSSKKSAGEDPFYYLPTTKLPAGSEPKKDQVGHPDLEEVVGGDVIVAGYVDEYTALIAAGVPLVEEILLERLKAVKDDPEFQLAIIMGEYATAYASDNVLGSRIRNLMRWAPKLVWAMLGRAPEEYDRITKHNRLINLLKDYAHKDIRCADSRIVERLLAANDELKKISEGLNDSKLPARVDFLNQIKAISEKARIQELFQLAELLNSPQSVSDRDEPIETFLKIQAALDQYKPPITVVANPIPALGRDLMKRKMA